MPSILTVGRFSLDGHLLVYMLAVIAGYLVMKIRLRHSGKEAQHVLDIALNSVVGIALLWKLGPLLFEPSIIWKKPWLILMIRGGWIELAFGLSWAIVYTIYKLRRLNISLVYYLDGLTYGILAATMCVSVLIWKYGTATSMPWGISLSDPSYRYHPLNMYVFLYAGLLLFWLWRRKLTVGGGSAVQDFLVWYGLGMWGISLLGRKVITGLIDSTQLVYLGLVVLGIAIPYIIRAVPKGAGAMKNARNNDSIEQRQQKEANEKLKNKDLKSEASNELSPSIKNKKTDGPNRPST